MSKRHPLEEIPKIREVQESKKILSKKCSKASQSLYNSEMATPLNSPEQNTK